MTYNVYDDNTATVISISESGLEDSKYVVIPSTITYSGKTISVTNFCLSGGDKLETCSSVTSVKIPSSLKSFVPGSFEDNVSFVKQLPNLKFFYIDSDNQYFADYHNQLLLSKDKTTLVCCPPGATDPTAVIFIGIKNFGAYAFNGCQLQKLIIPTSLESVDVHAFSGFSGLTSFENTAKNPNEKFVVHNGVLYEYRYHYDEGYQPYQLLCYPDAKTEENYTANLTDLASAQLHIASFAFDDVKALLKMNFSPAQGSDEFGISIGEYAFYNCKSLALCNFASFVNFIGAHAFENTGVVSIDLGSFSYSASSWGGKHCIIDSYAFKNSKLQSILFPTNSLPQYMSVQLNDYALADCPYLRNVSVCKYTKTPGAALAPIGKYAFANCPKLESIDFEGACPGAGQYGVLPEGLFFNCTSLKSFKIEGNVITEIGDYAFNNCNLQSWPFANQTNTLATIGKFAFSNWGLRYFFPEDNIQNHLGNVNLSEFEALKTIGEGAFLNSGISNDLLSFNSKVGIEKIERFTFAGNSFKKIYFPEGIKRIENDVFAGCSSLTFVHLPNSLESIVWTYDDGIVGGLYNSYLKPRLYISRYCKSLQRIEILNNEHYGTSLHGLLYDKKTMSLIHCPEDYKVTTKAGYSYLNVNGLILDDEIFGIKSLDSYSFIGSVLEKIVLPSSLEEIGLGAFLYSNLKSLTIPSKVKVIGAHMLGGTSSNNLDLFMMPVTPPTTNPYIWNDKPCTDLMLGRTDINIYVKKTAFENGNYDEWKGKCNNLTYKIPIPSTVTKKYQYFSVCRDFDINCGETNLAVYAIYGYNNSNNVKSRTLKRYVPSRVGANHDKYVGAIMALYTQPGQDTYKEDGNWYRIGEQDYASSKQNTRSDEQYLGPNFEYNWLVGCPIPTYVGVKADGTTPFYALKYKNNKVSRWAQYSASGVVPMNKAYLDLTGHEYPSSTQAKELGIIFDAEEENTATDIDEPIVDVNEVDGNQKAVYYNLNGVKVENPTKGIYVRNGKKVVIK